MHHKFPHRNDTLKAIKSRGLYPFAAYIYDDLKRMGYDLPNKVVLRHLRNLERLGFVTCSKFATGYYGFEWKLTEKGRASLG